MVRYGGGYGGGYPSGAGDRYGGGYDRDYSSARDRGYDSGYRGPGSDLGEDIRRGHVGRRLYSRSAVGPGARRSYGVDYRRRRGRTD